MENCKEKQDSRSVIVVIFLLLLLLVIFVLLIIISVFSPTLHTYELMEIDPVHKKTFFEAVQTNDILEGESFISHSHPEKGTFHVLKRQGGHEYHCTGSCLCNEQRRGAMAGTLTRGLTVFLSAFSVYMAQKIAKDAFHDRCLNQFSGSCEQEFIESEVESCDKSKEVHLEARENDGFENYQTKSYVDFRGDTIYETWRWHCEGKCVKDEANEDSEEWYLKAREFWGKTNDCEDIGTEHVMSYYQDEWWVLDATTQETKAGAPIWQMADFIKQKFKKYCEVNSVIGVEKNPIGVPGLPDFDVSACMAGNVKDNKIKCQVIFRTNHPTIFPDEMREDKGLTDKENIYKKTDDKHIRDFFDYLEDLQEKENEYGEDAW